jgi:hypothetical protein
MKSALTFIGFFLLAMGLFWAAQGADLIFISPLRASW